jgi:ribonuclease HI
MVENQSNRGPGSQLAPGEQVTVYTDGACLGNPGPGGYGAVLLYGSQRKELSGGFKLTTNNRMEITAALIALEALQKPCRVILYSDSQYLVNAMSKGWAQRWQANGWMRNKREDAVNPDLWERMLELCQHHTVDFQWVRGHSGAKENERCDRLAVAAARGFGLPDDAGYSR